MWMLAAGCAWAADGDLWLKIEDKDGQDRVVLNLPVSDLREATEPAILHTPSGDVDLRAEARGLRVGAERTWTTTTGEQLTLANVAPTGAPATLFAIGIGGPAGAGFEATFPLEVDHVRDVNAQVDAKVDLDVDGVSLALDDDACAQLKRSPPTLLVEIVGPKGNGLRVRTR